MHVTASEYDTWRCDPERLEDPCVPTWQHCDECKSGLDSDGNECPMCAGWGGGHICSKHHLPRKSDSATQSITARER